MQISRRNALLSAGAVVAVAGVPAVGGTKDAVLSALWGDWQCIHQELPQAYDEETAACEALPEWAAETKRTITGHECTLLTGGLPPGRHEAARRAIVDLDSPKYRSAHAALEATEQRIREMNNTQADIEYEIADTPAESLAGVRIKLRLADFWIRQEHSDREMNLDEAALRNEERLALSAFADIERLVGEA